LILNAHICYSHFRALRSKRVIPSEARDLDSSVAPLPRNDTPEKDEVNHV